MPSYSKLLVTSAKGGVGKSTTVLGLAAAFSSMTKPKTNEGYRVLLVDLDVNSRSLDVLCGCENDSVFDFADVLAEGDSLGRITVDNVLGCAGVSLIKACTYDRLAEAAESRGETVGECAGAIIDKIIECGEYDILICDTGGGIELSGAVADRFDLVLVTSEQSKTSVRSAEYAASKLSTVAQAPIRLVVCSFDLDAVVREKRSGIIEMIDSSSLQCVGVVPSDSKLQSAQDRATLPSKKSPSRIAYGNIAARIMGKETPLFNGIKKLERKKRRAF